MTSPPAKINVRCPACRTTYATWHRASVNLDLDDFDEEYLRQASTATCPSCRHVVELHTLVIRGDEWAVA